MADILIRGMEMPKNCLYCHFISYDNDHCVVMDKDIPIYGTKPSWCPLIALPEGHGRLIDAEAFEDAFIRYYLSQERNNHLVFTPVEIKQHLADMIGDWPTIVPAEGGMEDG